MSEMTLSEELQWRGFVNQTTFADLSQLDGQQLTFYHGFDASADSQAIGNLAAMMFDKVFMRHGHKAIILAGGATSLIGDPGGKDSERILQDEQTIAHNVERAEAQLQKVFAGHEFMLVNNLDWTRSLTVIEYLRDIGKHFSMTPLVQRDYIAKRLGEGGAGISYTEFSYTLLQGLDYLHLFDKYGVRLQLGGSDQWGNCLSGVELIRKARGQEVHVMTLPLIINKTTGKKFGKSEDGAVWLDPEKTSPSQFYQFWINVDDQGVEDYLKIFTELAKPGIEEIMSAHRADPKRRVAQSQLAYEVTKLVHGEEQAGVSRAIRDILTGVKVVGEADEAVLAAMRREVPYAKLSTQATIIEALVATGLSGSTSDARQLIKEKAIYVDGSPYDSEILGPESFHNGRLLLRKGKTLKNTALVEC